MFFNLRGGLLAQHTALLLSYPGLGPAMAELQSILALAGYVYVMTKHIGIT